MVKDINCCESLFIFLIFYTLITVYLLSVILLSIKRYQQFWDYRPVNFLKLSLYL